MRIEACYPHGDLDVVLAAELSEEDAALYDAFVERTASAHVSQTRRWAPLARAGRSVHSAHFLAKDSTGVLGAALVLRPRLGPLLAPIAFVERGPACASPEDLVRILPLLVRSLRMQGVARVAVMPYFAGAEKNEAEEALLRSGFRDVQRPDGAHVRTLRVDLRKKNPSQLFAGRERESLRRKLKQAENAGVRARRGNCGDVLTLERLHVNLMRAQKRNEKPHAYFDALAEIVDEEKGGAIFVAEHDGERIAALFASLLGAVATFVIGATTLQARPFSKMAPAMAEAIRWAHDRGAATFDLGGIPAPNDLDRKRASIAQFKFDFAKSPIDLTHEHVRWF